MKNSTLKRLTSLGFFILMLLCVLSPLECFAGSTRFKDAKMTVGDTKELTSATYTTFTYVWTIESGSDVVSILSGALSDTCVVRAEKEGNAVMKVVYTRYSPRTASYTIIYNIAVSAPTYTVTLDANGGSVYPSSVKIKDNEVLSLPTLNRAGYSFVGWFTDAVNGSQINSGDTMHITGDSKLYAHWEQQQPIEISTAPSSITAPSNSYTLSNSYDDPFCSTCDGLGDCPKCFGIGYDDCSSCFNGRCSHCGGSGEILSYSYGGVKSRSCTYCHGSGSCSRCNGLGKIMCSRCSGRGICPTCNGSGFKPGRSLDEYSPTPVTPGVPQQNPATPKPGIPVTPGVPQQNPATPEPALDTSDVAAIVVVAAVAVVGSAGLALNLKKKR